MSIEPPDDHRVAVYQSFRILPEHERPAYIYREYGKTIIAIDPRDSRLAITTSMVDNLTIDEQNACRAAYGVGPVDLHQIPTAYVSDEPAMLYVPLMLRLPGEPAIQGDVVLDALVAAGNLPCEELRMLAHEPPSLERARELAMWSEIGHTIKQPERSRVG